MMLLCKYVITLLLSGVLYLSLSVTVFVSRCSVLYFSVHRYEESLFWPHLPEGDSGAVGSGPGEGYNINVPWNKVKKRTRACSCIKHTPGCAERISSSLSFFIAVCVGVQTGMEDGDYVSAFQRILLPVAYEVLSTLLKSLTYSRDARPSMILLLFIYQYYCNDMRKVAISYSQICYNCCKYEFIILFLSLFHWLRQLSGFKSSLNSYRK